MNKCLLISLFLLGTTFTVNAQNLDEKRSGLEQQIEALDLERSSLVAAVEDIKLQIIQRDLKAVGLPSDHYIEHSAMFLEYSEVHEQARWVAHIIHPDVVKGSVFRTNDFREDPLVTTGTAVEADYFLKYLQADSTYEYDGFGYDRGHLAPSADFRWSQKALSESYFYSNMSPQVARFNREGWAELEGSIRGYVREHPETQLYVVTGPVLEENLPVIERSINKVAIPKQYFKVVLDLDSGKSIGFIIPNKSIDQPLDFYATTVDEVEQLTGLDFFPNIDKADQIENQLEILHWLPDTPQGDVDPVYAPSLPPGHFNTVQAKSHIGRNKTITVVGRVVGSRYSRSGNLWFNLDKQFPNQIFSVFIKKDDLVNFDFDPKETFEGQLISVKGKVLDFSGVPTMKVERAEWIEEFGG